MQNGHHHAQLNRLLLRSDADVLSRGGGHAITSLASQLQLQLSIAIFIVFIQINSFWTMVIAESQ